MDEKIISPLPQESETQEEENFDENKNEVFNANLFTNYETTIEFMKVIEGPGWLEDQENMGGAKNTFEHIMNWLKDPNNNQEITTLYGNRGANRYEIYRDGSVKFLSHFSTAKTLERAKNLCFPIDQ